MLVPPVRRHYHKKVVKGAVAYAESYREGAKVSSQSCDVTNQLYGECPRHDHSRVVRRNAPEKFCKIIPKNAHFRAFWKQVLV